MPTRKNNAHIIPNASGKSVINSPWLLNMKSVDRGVSASPTDDINRLVNAQKQKKIKLEIRKNNAASGNLIVSDTSYGLFDSCFEKAYNAHYEHEEGD